LPKIDILNVETDNKVDLPYYIEENEYSKMTKAIYNIVLDAWELFKELGLPYFHSFVSTNAFSVLYKYGLDYYGHRGINTAYEIAGHRGGLLGIKDVGQFEGEYYKLDINSAYPYAMQAELPYGLADVIEDPSINDIKDKMCILDIEYSITKPVVSCKICLMKLCLDPVRLDLL